MHKNGNSNHNGDGKAIRFPYHYIIEDISEGDEEGYRAIIPKFPNMHIVGDTPAQLHEVVKIFIQEEIEDLKKEGKQIPKPDKTSFSGRFVLRIEPEMHETLTQLSKAEGKTLNQYLNKILGNYLR